MRPTNLAAVLVMEDNRILRSRLNGGPKWDGKGAIINARAETALEKKMFRDSLLSRRCVMPRTGYYEWKRAENGQKKDKYFFSQADNTVLYMAGIIGDFSSVDGEVYEAFTILTTAALVFAGAYWYNNLTRYRHQRFRTGPKNIVASQ